MKISFEISERKTCSGKQALNFTCEHCKTWHLDLSGFFYNSLLDKTNLQSALEIFVDKINKKEDGLFEKKSTCNKLYKYHLCNCDENVIDMQSFKQIQNAKKIRDIGILILSNSDKN